MDHIYKHKATVLVGNNLERNIEKNFQNLALGKEFLGMIPKDRYFLKLIKLDIIKVKNILLSTRSSWRQEEDEKISFRLGEYICKTCNRPCLVHRLPKEFSTFSRFKKIQLKYWQKTWRDISPKMICKWKIITWKDI